MTTLLFQLPVDEFYSSAIKNIVKASSKPGSEGETDLTLMSQFLIKIQDFQYALGICKWLAMQLPNGKLMKCHPSDNDQRVIYYTLDEDRIEILKSGLDLALQYGQQATTEVG